jgi:hypothetical protein
MEIIDNINRLLGDNLKQSIVAGAKLKIAASCFSIYAFEALKAELEQIDSLEFIFTSPTFVPNEVTDPVRRERREFHIPKLERERGFYGTEFEIRLKNKLTQRAIAKECAAWMRRKAAFRSNRTQAPMQQFACLRTPAAEAVYMPLHGFTAVDLGYQQGNAVSNMVNRMDEPPVTATYINLAAGVFFIYQFAPFKDRPEKEVGKPVGKPISFEADVLLARASVVLQCGAYHPLHGRYLRSAKRNRDRIRAERNQTARKIIEN